MSTCRLAIQISLYNNWGGTSIIYVPTEHNRVTHHLATSRDKACFRDGCEFTDTQNTHSRQRRKSNPSKQSSLREPNSQFSVNSHSLGVLTLRFLAIFQLRIFIFGKKSSFWLVASGFFSFQWPKQRIKLFSSRFQNIFVWKHSN